MMNMLSLNRFPLSGKRRCRGGFTLLEVMIAIAVLAISLTVIYGSQSQSVSLATESKFNTTAALLLKQKVAELESGVVDLREDEGDFGDEYPNFRWKIEVDEADLGGYEFAEEWDRAFKRARVTISWENSPFSRSVDYYLQEKEEL
jgi:general secretion pathway protein I